jgi:hypothetical protein
MTTTSRSNSPPLPWTAPSSSVLNQASQKHQYQGTRRMWKASRRPSKEYLLIFFVVLNLLGVFMIFVAEHGQLQVILSSSSSSLPIWLKSQNLHHSNTNLDEGRMESLRRLQALGINMTELDDETIRLLPPWPDVVAQYGDKAVVLGLETCQKYRRVVAPRLRQRLLAAAGTFNSGTNLLAFTLENNCQLSDGKQLYGGCRLFHRGINWQVPWYVCMIPTSIRGETRVVHVVCVCPVVHFTFMSLITHSSITLALALCIYIL